MLCDDIELSENGSTWDASRACELGQSHFQIEQPPKPTCRVSGDEAALAVALGRATELLAGAKAPLICGLNQLSTQAQQAAWKIADCVGATIDTTLSNDGRSNMFALQQSGKVSATLGEIASRSDVIVFWFCDPVTTHPRLLERLAKPTGHPKRRVIVVDEQETSTAKQADRFFQIQKTAAPALLAVLRANLLGADVDASRVESSTGLSGFQVSDLLTMLTSASYGSLLYDQSNPDSVFDLESDSLSRLVRSLNDTTRFVALKLRHDANAQSGENVLAWSSGFSFAVNHALGFPRSNWLEHSAETVLVRGECDAVLWVGGKEAQAEIAGLPQAAQDTLQSVPVIFLSSGLSTDARGGDEGDVQLIQPHVEFEIGLPGLSGSGEFVRLDDVSLPVKTAGNAMEPSALSILEQVRVRLEEWQMG